MTHLESSLGLTLDNEFSTLPLLWWRWVQRVSAMPIRWVEKGRVLSAWQRMKSRNFTNWGIVLVDEKEKKAEQRRLRETKKGMMDLITSACVCENETPSAKKWS